MKKIYLKWTAGLLILIFIFLIVCMFIGMSLGHSGDEIRNGVSWDSKMLAPIGRKMPYDMFNSYAQAGLYQMFTHTLYFSMMIFIGTIIYFNFRMLGWKPTGLVPGSIIIVGIMSLLCGLALGLSKIYGLYEGLAIGQIMFLLISPTLALCLAVTEWNKKEEGI